MIKWYKRELDILSRQVAYPHLRLNALAGLTILIIGPIVGIVTIVNLLT